MEKVGRRRDEVWERVTLLEGVRRWKCNDCGEEFAGGASRVKAHVNKVIGGGIRPCIGKAYSNNDTEHNLLHSQGKVKMEKVGRQRDEAWEQVMKLEEGWKCNDCGEEFAGGACRIKAHVNKVKGTSFQPCIGKANSNNDTEHNLLHSQGKVKMEKVGRRRDEAWERVTKLEEGWKCNDCGEEFAGGYSRIKAHVNKVKGRGIRPCTAKANSNNDIEHNLLHSQGKVKMEKVGRRRDEAWERVTKLEEGWKCNDCGEAFVGGDSRIKAHINKVQGQGIQLCTGKANSNNDTEHNLLHSQGKVKMEKVGRRRDEACERVTKLEEGWKCNDRVEAFAGGDSRIKAHINKVKGTSIQPCTGKANSTNDIEHNLLHSQGQIQANDAEDQERTQDLQMMKRYVFECLRPEDKVIVSPLSYLSQEEFITLKPETSLDSSVIDTFVEMLTDIERKKKTMPLNWYLPVTFSDSALKGKVSYFLNFVHCQKITENYMSDLESCDKIFIPVYDGARPNGYFYLYIIHLKNKEIQIWDSLPSTSEAEIEETAKKLLIAMEKLFEKVTFTEFHLKKANDILLQHNGFDCGVFVINYMQQSDNYVKRDSSFQFDSQKEREDLAFKLLNNDLNKEKQNLYDKARRHYAQVEKQDHNKRLRVDPSKEHFEDVGRDMEVEYDDSDEEDDDFDKEYDDEEDDDEEDDDSDEDDDGLENDLIGWNFQRYTQQIREWIEDDKVSAIGVWGMGGSGKTALASHVHDKLLEEGDIKVIWVTVSQNSIYKLQKFIARAIKLDISDEYEVKRIARKLFQAFKEMKKCVVILDDVWDHFFLKEVGFPMSDNRIKLILTTRIWEVCQGMGCDQKNKIEVESLDARESLALFQKTMGFYEGLSLEVKRIARKVAYECKGLPLAIVRIATSMKGKEQLGEWSHMLECLKHLDNGQYEMDKWVFPVLRSSYDFLSKKLQRFFLYCALSTKGVLDDKKAYHLIRIFVYESIDETKKLRVQYDEGYKMLDRLKNHSMLERYDGKWRMNKFLGALATGIAKDTGKIMANAYKNLTKIPSDDQWKDDLQKAFLTRNKIKTIPNGTCLRGSQLSTLLLNGNANLNYISDDSFKNMPALKILDLSRTRIKRLPESVSSLKCLTTLLLSECRKLSYIPSLSKLKQLISLDLSDTAITEAPMGLDSLVNLRCLNLFCTYMLMSASLISKLINLDDLEVIVAHFWDISVLNAYVSFLDQHHVLRSYHLTLRNSSYVSYYEGINTEYSMKRITFCDMDLRNRKAVLPRDIKELVIRDSQLVATVGSCLFSVVSYGHNNNDNPHQIERLDISGCKDVEYLCCFSSSCPFCSSSQFVARLFFSSLKDLKDIVSPDALLSLHPPDLFSHLTDLSIWRCNSMKTLITPKLLALFRNLCTIDVSDCQKMKEIVGEDDHSKMELGGSGDLSHPTPITLPRLTSLKLYYMPQLNFVYRGVMLCPSLQTFFTYKCEKLNPPWIEISNGCELPMEKTFTGYRWEIKTD